MKDRKNSKVSETDKKNKHFYVTFRTKRVYETKNASLFIKKNKNLSYYNNKKIIQSNGVAFLWEISEDERGSRSQRNVTNDNNYLRKGDKKANVIPSRKVCGAPTHPKREDD